VLTGPTRGRQEPEQRNQPNLPDEILTLSRLRTDEYVVDNISARLSIVGTASPMMASRRQSKAQQLAQSALLPTTPANHLTQKGLLTPRSQPLLASVPSSDDMGTTTNIANTRGYIYIRTGTWDEHKEVGKGNLEGFGLHS
jgi:hypothetical protein